MRKYTLKALRVLVANGLATDITKTHDRNAIPESYETIGYAKGIYGCIGKLFRGKSGRLYAVIGATSALYMF